MKRIFFVFFIFITLSFETESRNKGCGILILVDDTMMSEIKNKENVLRKKVDHFISELNTIYQNTILAEPPHNDLYFYVKHVTHLKNFLPDCNNGGVCLNEIRVRIFYIVFLRSYSAMFDLAQSIAWFTF